MYVNFDTTSMSTSEVQFTNVAQSVIFDFSTYMKERQEEREKKDTANKDTDKEEEKDKPTQVRQCRHTFLTYRVDIRTNAYE